MPHYMVKCTSLTPAMWIDLDPKDNLNEARLSHQDNAKVITVS